MTSQSKRYAFTRAEPGDSNELLEILEDGNYEGNISLQYTRRPDAYISLKGEGVDVEIVVCRDLKQGEIIGFGACAINLCYINGIPQKVGYLFGLRMRNEYRKRALVVHKTYAYLREVLAEKQVAYYLTSILAENKYAQDLLGKERKFMPKYQPCIDYEVFSLKTARYTKKSRFGFRRAEKADIPQIISFLTVQGQSRNFFPVVSEQDLLSESPWNASYEDMCILTIEQRIVACGALWDRQKAKQYIVKNYGGIYKYVQPLSWLLNFLGYPALPPRGSELNFFTLSFWGVEDDNPEFFTEFIDRMASNTDYSFFNVGLPENCSFGKILRKKQHLLYKSKIYLVSWEAEAYTAFTDSKIYIEGGRL